MSELFLFLGSFCAMLSSTLPFTVVFGLWFLGITKEDIHRQIAKWKVAPPADASAKAKTEEKEQPQAEKETQEGREAPAEAEGEGEKEKEEERESKGKEEFDLEQFISAWSVEESKKFASYKKRFINTELLHQGVLITLDPFVEVALRRDPRHAQTAESKSSPEERDLSHFAVYFYLDDNGSSSTGSLKIKLTSKGQIDTIDYEDDSFTQDDSHYISGRGLFKILDRFQHLLFQQDQEGAPATRD